MNIKMIFLVGFGFLCLGLAAIGLLLPVWPTTPFVIVAAACFSGTPRLRAKLMRISFFREYIENYSSRRGLARRTVNISLLYLWGMLIISMLLIRRPWIYVLLTCIGIAVTIHIIYIAKPKQK